MLLDSHLILNFSARSELKLTNVKIVLQPSIQEGVDRAGEVYDIDMQATVLTQERRKAIDFEACEACGKLKQGPNSSHKPHEVLRCEEGDLDVGQQKFFLDKLNLGFLWA